MVEKDERTTSYMPISEAPNGTKTMTPLTLTAPLNFLRAVFAVKPGMGTCDNCAVCTSSTPILSALDGASTI